MTYRALIVALLSLCLLLGALITRNGDLALMALPFLTYLGAGIWGAPALEKMRLRATRSVRVMPSGGNTAVEVGLTVHNEGPEMVALRVVDPLEPGSRVIEGSPQPWLALAAGEEAELRYTFEAERGGFRWESLAVVAGDPFGLFASRLELPAAGELQIRPALKKFRPIALRPDSTLHAPGSIPARRGGSGTDFWGVREYHPGDALRRLDWRLTARHPRQFFTREFEHEEVADISLILDARQRVDVRKGEDGLFEHSLSATASLAEMFLHQGHRVSLLIFGDQMTTVFPGYSKVQLNRILSHLATARPGSSTSRLSLEFLSLRMFSSRALLVILSPLAPGDWPLFPRLRTHGNQVLLISPDPIDFALRGLEQDRAGRLGLRAARVERQVELRKIAQMQTRVIDWQVNQPLAPLVRNAFRQSPRPRGQSSL